MPCYGQRVSLRPWQFELLPPRPSRATSALGTGDRRTDLDTPRERGTCDPHGCGDEGDDDDAYAYDDEIDEWIEPCLEGHHEFKSVSSESRHGTQDLHEP